MPDGHIKVGGVWKTVNSLHVKVSGVWKQVNTAYIKIGGVWKIFHSALSLSASDLTPTGSDSGPLPTGSVTSNTTTITPTGGKAPYSYAWAQSPGGPATDGPFTCNSPTAATADWTATCTDGAADTDEQWTCTVTDDNGIEETITVTVTLVWSQVP